MIERSVRYPGRYRRRHADRHRRRVDRYTVTVNPDGTYVAYARSGTYRVEFYVQDPHEFIDSVDSDLIYYWNETGGYNNYGYTDWVTVATGDQVTLDAGVK